MLILLKFTSLFNLFIFIPFVCCEKINFLNPEKLISNSYNFYLNEIGIWHIVPFGKPKSLLSLNERPTILFLHGIASSRGGYGRIEFYKIFQRLEYNVICFDYRGFADSKFVIPSKKTVVEDSLCVYNLIKKNSNQKIIVCGHSFGTSIALELNKGDGLILLNAFNTMEDIIQNFPFNFWSFFNLYKNLENFDLNFNPTKKIKEFKNPILFIHSKKDKIIPIKFGIKLFSESKNSLFKIVNRNHTDMYKSKKIPLIFKNFLNNITKSR